MKGQVSTELCLNGMLMMHLIVRDIHKNIYFLLVFLQIL